MKPDAADTSNKDNLQKACRDFESVMIEQMITIMRRSAPKEGIFGKSYAEDMLQSMQDEQLAKSLADKGGMGLGDALYNQLSGRYGKR